MHPSSLPESILSRFRALSLERIGRVESVWNSLVQGGEDEEGVRTAARDLHTLKGDAKVVGFEEVHVLSHKLEELFALAAQQQYRVSEDFELVVTMATQFVGMLLRKKSAGASGIDLVGFVRQVDDVIRETRVLRRSRPTNPRGSKPGELEADRISEASRQRLATAATHAFIEYLGARHPRSRTRLRGIWLTLKDQLTNLQALPLMPLLQRHIPASRELAASLGKRVRIELEISELRLESRVAEAVDLAIVHLIRNAIDHGIELPAAREAAGKLPIGGIKIHARETTGQLEIEISDDGDGIDLHAVRARAIANGLVDANRTLAEHELHELLFQPGFTTKAEATDVSGRGIGMDAVKSAINRVGGSVRLSTMRGQGTSVVLALPALTRQIRVFKFLAPGNAVNLAVSARWSPSVEAGTDADAIDPIAAIDLVGGSRQTITGLVQPPRDLLLRLRWGFLEIALRTSTEPVLVTAERICPTIDDEPVEVILIDGIEALLLRPELVAQMVRRERDG